LQCSLKYLSRILASISEHSSNGLAPAAAEELLCRPGTGTLEITYKIVRILQRTQKVLEASRGYTLLVR
jgi:hypothetical protein